MRTSTKIGLSLLFAGLAVTPACKGVPQPPAVDTAGLTIEVEKAKQGRRGIDVALRIWNSYDERVTFEMGSVRLVTYDNVEYSALQGRAWNRRTPTVQAKANQDFRWVFQTRDELPPGNYRVEIRDFMLNDVPSGQTATFEIAL